MLRGSLAAAITPLRRDGADLDEDAFVPYVDFLVGSGLDGILALGTTGEGILLSTDERKRAAELFLAAAARRFQGPVHCRAQTAAAADAAAPLPFYLYEFKARTGYSIPLSVIERLGDRVAGLKVSNQSWEAVEPYLLEGVDVFIGPESLVARGLERGAAGGGAGLPAPLPPGGPRKRGGPVG